MSELLVLTDATLETVLTGDRPALILVSNGDGLRSDFVSAYKKAAEENADVVIAKIDPTAQPQAAARFDVGSKPVLIGWYDGQEMVRRPRPWGTDVPLALEMLKNAYQEGHPASLELEKVGEQPVSQAVIVDDKPIHVTDVTFEAEVLNYDKPVLIDFWAEWCGPCRMVAPILEKLAKEFAGQIRVAKVNVDENPGLSQAFKVMSIPTIMLVKQRTIVFSQPGALPEAAFRDLIQQLIALELPPPDKSNEEEVVEQ
ncbi:MAG TPA: thioredoxin [Phototrophicaceae bacterium]|nr:thioredoxin [Phototrophicaceae bacterium]